MEHRCRLGLLTPSRPHCRRTRKAARDDAGGTARRVGSKGARSQCSGARGRPRGCNGTCGRAMGAGGPARAGAGASVPGLPAPRRPPGRPPGARDGAGWPGMDLFLFSLSAPPGGPSGSTACDMHGGERGAGRGARARARTGPRRSLARGGAGSPRRPPGQTSLQALRERARQGGVARVCGAPHAGPGPEVGGPGGPGAGDRGGRAGRKTSEPCLKGAAGARL